jgi:hypothetical protein
VFDELFYRLLLARIRDATGGHALEALRADRMGAIHTRTVKIFKRTISLIFTASSLTPPDLEFQPDMSHTEVRI